MRRLFVLALLGCANAEDGINGWLRYAPLPDGIVSNFASSGPSSIALLNSTKGSPVVTAGSELEKGYRGILGKSLSQSAFSCNGSSSIVVGTLAAYSKACGTTSLAGIDLVEDGFWLSHKPGEGVLILGQNEPGALYGAFEHLSMLAQGNFTAVAVASNPSVPIRWANHWDNLNAGGGHGSIERGYAGPSLFFSNNAIVSDLSRIPLYARLLASVRINAIVLNNVNADANLLSDNNINGLARIADAFRPYGVRIGMSLNFASPQQVGGLSTFDPLDRNVVSFWTRKTDQIYSKVPDFAGYLVKANSEGQPGPLTYQRTLADGANMFAKALKPHGGVIMFRAFVYNQLDYNNRKADRANAAVDFFKSLDGKFDANVVVQIKYGPIDFQVREPASPLFANLPRTAAAIELQITQEYLGQQCHLVYLAPLWKTVLDFDLRVGGKQSLVRDVLTGQRSNGKLPLGGFAGVVNAGTDRTWLGSHLAMSNLYAFGRLAWDATQESEAILQDWTRLTFGLDSAVMNAITTMSMQSWPAYENYTGNLGLQTLTDILGTHYGPNPASQDGNGWGQWTRADRNGIGMDRSVATGTGNAGQYPPEVATRFEKVETTPDDLMLWFHHVPYTQKLKSGETVIQRFYNAHYAGAETAQTFPILWMGLEGKIDKERYDHVLYRLNYQAGHSIVWRDFICAFYLRMSNIKDEKGRVGSHPYRIEAESMTLSGYSRAGVSPAEAGSGGAAVAAGGGRAGTATTTLKFPAGTYNIGVNYFDISNGKAKWELSIGVKVIGSWTGDIESRMGKTGSNSLSGDTAARMLFRNITIAEGDSLKVTGTPNGGEGASLDYVVVLPPGVVD